MRLGRLEFWKAKGCSGYELWGSASCGCYFIQLGKMGLTWLSKECKEADVEE
jgi:hypothetical protein